MQTHTTEQPNGNGNIFSALEGARAAISDAEKAKAADEKLSAPIRQQLETEILDMIRGNRALQHATKSKKQYSDYYDLEIDEQYTRKNDNRSQTEAVKEAQGHLPYLKDRLVYLRKGASTNDESKELTARIEEIESRSREQLAALGAEAISLDKIFSARNKKYAAFQEDRLKTERDYSGFAVEQVLMGHEMLKDEVNAYAGKYLDKERIEAMAHNAARAIQKEERTRIATEAYELLRKDFNTCKNILAEQLKEIESQKGKIEALLTEARELLDSEDVKVNIDTYQQDTSYRGLIGRLIKNKEFKAKRQKTIEALSTIFKEIEGKLKKATDLLWRLNGFDLGTQHWVACGCPNYCPYIELLKQKKGQYKHKYYDNQFTREIEAFLDTFDKHVGEEGLYINKKFSEVETLNLATKGKKEIVGL